MNFWEVISQCANRTQTITEVSSCLESALKAMPASTVQEFCVEFDKKMGQAYTWGLWGVAYLINGGCSDDAFIDFRASLIAQGQAVFEKAVTDPESLLELGHEQLEALFEEGVLYCGPAAFEAITGNQPTTEVRENRSPSGTEWEESRESLARRFPRAWAVYGWQETTPQPGHSPHRPWWKFW